MLKLGKKQEKYKGGRKRPMKIKRIRVNDQKMGKF